MSAFGGKADVDAHPRSHMIERAPADHQCSGGNEGGFAMAILPPTATTVFDSILFRDAFGTPRMREVFSDYALISRYVEVEIALARAQARCGVIPAEAADQIAAKSNVTSLDFDVLRHETDIVGYPILPLVHQLVKQCDDAGRYIHWGATTQDIMDTAVVLQVRDALTIIEEDINELRGILAKLAKKYRDTPMAGRTHLQQALPVTFGYKCKPRPNMSINL